MLGEVKRILYNPETKKYSTTQTAGGKRTSLVFDTTTKIVYYKFGGHGGEGYMTPYIGPKGKFCKLVANEIVEIN